MRRGQIRTTCWHRQAEIEDLVARLARWGPQQIAVEWPFTFADSTRARYDRFRAGTLAPSRNEVVQVGFRLAHRLGHEAVYPIDQQVNIGNDSLPALFERRPDLRRRSDSLRAVLQARSDSGSARMQVVWAQHRNGASHHPGSAARRATDARTRRLRTRPGDAQPSGRVAAVLSGQPAPAAAVSSRLARCVGAESYASCFCRSANHSLM
ncbi:hypothetical protein BH23GEM2_BH23GEM2_04770 [soil metagenome]